MLCSCSRFARPIELMRYIPHAVLAGILLARLDIIDYRSSPIFDRPRADWPHAARGRVDDFHGLDHSRGIGMLIAS